MPSCTSLDEHIGEVQLGNNPPSFTYFLNNPAAKDAYSEVLPGALRAHDVPDLQQALKK